MKTNTHYLLFRFTAFIREQGLLDDAYIVGGAVRDLIMNNALHDIDIVLKGDCQKISKEFACVVDAVCVTLDEDFSIIRIIKDDKWIDISRIRCDSIFIDLSERDFTINAMAIPLKALDSPFRSLIDIYGGLEDLSEGYIRMVTEENFIKDPLRIIRAVRFATTLDFAIEGKTLKAMKDLAPLISSVAYERIADELRKILICKNSSIAMRLMVQMRLMTHIFAMSFYESSLIYFFKLEKLLCSIDEYLSDFKDKFEEYLSEELRLITIKFVAFFDHPEDAVKGANQLKMSRKEIDLIKTFSNKMNTLINFYKKGITYDSEEIILLLSEVRHDLYGVVLLDLSHYIDEPDGFTSYVRDIILFYEGTYKEREKKLPILTGNDLIRELRIESSPIFKKLLKAIEVLFLLGKIKTKEDAIKEALSLYNAPKINQ